jgi:hypothetical protein
MTTKCRDRRIIYDTLKGQRREAQLWGNIWRNAGGCANRSLQNCVYALLLPKAHLNPLVMFAIHVFHGRFVRLIVTLPDPSVRSLSPPMATAFELG